jgi:hypothetical protein
VGHYRFSEHSFDPETLSALYDAFDGAWKLVEGRTDASTHDAIRDGIALTIISLAKSGETDVERLMAWAVARARSRLAAAAGGPVGAMHRRGDARRLALTMRANGVRARKKPAVLRNN